VQNITNTLLAPTAFSLLSAGLPPGQHKVKIELVDPNHNVFPGQVVMLTFTVPDYKSAHLH
jgi:hypothetical protein